MASCAVELKCSGANLFKNVCPVSQYVWNVKEPSLRKAEIAKHICSPVTGIDGDSRHSPDIIPEKLLVQLKTNKQTL
jgi:hypothetical protein